MLIIFTGNGKGKTTAALGQALRAIGNGAHVLMVQFIKGPWKSGEDTSSGMLNTHLKIVKKGKGFVGLPSDKLPFEEHVQAAREALTYAEQEAKSGKWSIIILDEVWVALSLGLITREEVSHFIDSTDHQIEHLIMTGRGCPTEFINRADLVTEMLEIKHPFATGIKAAKNVEF